MLMLSPCILWLFLLCSHITSLWLQSRSRSQHTYVHLALKLLRDCLVTSHDWCLISILVSIFSVGSVRWDQWQCVPTQPHLRGERQYCCWPHWPGHAPCPPGPPSHGSHWHNSHCWQLVVLIPSLCAHSSRAVALIYGATLRTRLKTDALKLAGEWQIAKRQQSSFMPGHININNEVLLHSAYIIIGKNKISEL